VKDHSKHCIILSAALNFSASSVVTNDVRLEGAFEVRVCEHCLNGSIIASVVNGFSILG
jgi:hypothetical protein